MLRETEKEHKEAVRGAEFAELWESSRGCMVNHLRLSGWDT